MMVSRRAALGAALLPAAGFLMGAGKVPLAAVPISRMDLGWWRARHEAKLAELRRGPVELVWLGDSITENWEKPEFRPAWERLYGRRHAVNLGFKGDATSHLLWRMMNGELAGIAPRAAVILIGANNLGRLHWPAADSVRGIGAVVAEARRRLPGTRILLMGVLPSDRGAWAAEATVAINRALAAEFDNARVPGVVYRDVSALFMRNGVLDRSQFYDPSLSPPEPALHPTPAAQERMAMAIEPALAEMLRPA